MGILFASGISNEIFKTMKHVLICILFSAVAASCSNKNISKEPEAVTKSGILTDDMAAYGDNANTEIVSASITGSVISIEVNYSGGCEEHEFILLGSKLIAKSLPPKRGITLHHNSNGDSCRELKNEVLKFDISEFAYTPGEEIILNLEGYKTPLSYTSK